MRTFYEILGVNRKATQEEILVAYRKRCLETHPDRGGNETDFLNVRKGYEILSNPQKRIEYDKWVKAKEENETKNDISLIKKRLEPWVNSFLNQYCQDDFFRTLIMTYFYGTDSIYNNINRAKLNKILTAEIVKNILVIIREDNTYKIESVLALDSICNDILLGRKDIKISQKIEKKPKKKEDVINEIDKENEKKFSTIVGCFILLLGIGFIFWLVIEGKDKYEKQHEPVYTSSDETTIRNKKNNNPFVVGKANNASGKTSKKYNIYDKYVDEEDVSNKPTYREAVYKTGDCPYLGWYGKGKKDSGSLSELKILNYSSTEAVVLLESSYGSVIRHVYVKNNSTYTMKNIPEGRYRMKVMYGNSWNNEKDNGSGYPKGGFMKNVSFSKSKDDELFDFMFEKTYEGISYPTYSVTLHKVVNGNMQTESIDKDDFF